MARIRLKLTCIFILFCTCFRTMDAERIERAPYRVAAPESADAEPEIPFDREFREAIGLFRLGRFAEAERQFAAMALRRPTTRWAERGQYYLAECQFQQKRYSDALDSFERLRTSYPATAYLTRLVRREYEMAQVWLASSERGANDGGKARVMARSDGRPVMVDAEKMALVALEHVLWNDPTGPLAGAAAIQYADYHMKQGDYRTAALYYDQFIVDHLQSPFWRRARRSGLEARILSVLVP